mmetsp:Transcript_7737/g.12125  ORF Transcript_7737/g.12125 Transcript_7737/m.12125 type:complete len:275 (-) Transcript_7737:1969-2793(-)
MIELPLRLVVLPECSTQHQDTAARTVVVGTEFEIIAFFLCLDHAVNVELCHLVWPVDGQGHVAPHTVVLTQPNRPQQAALKAPATRALRPVRTTGLGTARHHKPPLAVGVRLIVDVRDLASVPIAEHDVHPVVPRPFIHSHVEFHSVRPIRGQRVKAIDPEEIHSLITVDFKECVAVGKRVAKGEVAWHDLRSLDLVVVNVARAVQMMAISALVFPISSKRPVSRQPHDGTGVVGRAGKRRKDVAARGPETIAPEPLAAEALRFAADDLAVGVR